MIPTDGRKVANYILDFCEARGRSVTNLSLQKILYFCHAWFLVNWGKPLIRHKFEAWEYGPVLQYVYRDFQASGSSPISARATELDAATGKRLVARLEEDTEVTEFLNRIIDFYSQTEAGDLVRLSHAPGGPWDKVWNHKARTKPGMLIDDAAIREFYSTARSPFQIQ